MPKQKLIQIFMYELDGPGKTASVPQWVADKLRAQAKEIKDLRRILMEKN